MQGFEIIGTGHYVPGKPVTNHDLARVMDTSDEWIFQRSGIRQRHFVSEGMGVSDLALEASRKAIEAAGISTDTIDYIVFATMMPEYLLPGSGALLAHKLGLKDVPALDIRAQCTGTLFGFQVVDGLFKSGAAKTVLFVGAEAHAGLMPWEDWGALDPDNHREATPEAREITSRDRAVAVLFGDGAGALVFRATDRDAGPKIIEMHTDGSAAKLLYLEAGGFRSRPFCKPSDYHERKYIPTMDGREVFKYAVTRLPECARSVCARTGTPIESIDWFLAHQANARINDYVRKALGVPEHKLPSNIERFGNTSAATIPILIDEQTRAGNLKHGDLCMLLALGAGLHWGCALVRW